MSQNDKITMTHGEFTDLYCSSMSNVSADAAARALDHFADMLDAGEFTECRPLERRLTEKIVHRIAKHARQVARNFRSSTLAQMTPNSFHELSRRK